jgi:hypothetical protein
MIRSLSSWHSSDVTRWSADQRRYREHLKKVGRHLPPALQRFVREFTLHGDRISGVQIISGMPSGRDALVTIDGYRDGYVGTAALLVLHLVGIRGAVKKVPADLDIMFFDVDRLAPSMFQLGFAFDESRTWSVKFQDFCLYHHDYQKRGDPAAPDDSGQRPALPSVSELNRRAILRVR